MPEKEADVRNVLREDLMWVRKGLGLPDPTKYDRVSTVFRQAVLEAAPGDSTDFATRATKHMLRILAALPKEIRESSLVEFNAHEVFGGKDLTERQHDLAMAREVSPKTVIREGEVGLQSLVSALINRSAGGEPLPSRVAELMFGRRMPAESHPGVPQALSNPPSGSIATNQRGSQLTRRIERHLGSIRTWARSIANIDCGLPSDCAGSPSGTWTTSGLLWALGEAGEPMQEVWVNKALTWTLDNRNTDGAIPVMQRGDASVTDATAQTVLALALSCKANKDDYLTRPLNELTRWIILRRASDAGWPWRPDLEPQGSWVGTSVFAVLALRSASEALQVSHPGTAEDALTCAKIGLEWIVSLRNRDGGWPGRGGAPSSVAATGLVCYALRQMSDILIPPDDPVSALRRVQTVPPDLLDRPAGHTVVRWALAYQALGLSSWESSPESRRAVTRLLGALQSDHFVYRDTTMHTWPTRDGTLALVQYLQAQARNV